MNIPMLNEINENTNAAKNEILQAMPAAGATSAEVEAAKTAIIGAMPSGGAKAPVSVKTSSYTFNKNAAQTGLSMTGKGYAYLRFNVQRNDSSSAKIVIDGVTFFDGNLFTASNLFGTFYRDTTEEGSIYTILIRVDKSILVQGNAGTTNSSYSFYLSSMVYFEE